MKIILSPQRRDDAFVVVKNGNTLIVNGEEFDFSPMSEGDTLPYTAITSIWFVQNVEMIDGQLVVTLLFPNPYNYSHAQAFPEPLLNVPDGIVQFPLPLSEAETLAKFPPKETEHSQDNWTTGPSDDIEITDSESAQ